MGSMGPLIEAVRPRAAAIEHSDQCVVSDGVEDAADRVLRLCRRVRVGASGPIGRGEGLALRRRDR